MQFISLEKEESKILEGIPHPSNEIGILTFLSRGTIGPQHIHLLKKITGFNDTLLSTLLNVSPRTMGSYKRPDTVISDAIKEKLVLLISLFKHGTKVLGSFENFEQWLKTPNFFFDKSAPMIFLNSITGIRYVDNRLTAMEYGDNV